MTKSKEEIENLCVMLLECNLIGNTIKLSMNFGASHHICANEELFLVDALIQADEKIFMVNSAMIKVERKRRFA